MWILLNLLNKAHLEVSSFFAVLLLYWFARRKMKREEKTVQRIAILKEPERPQSNEQLRTSLRCAKRRETLSEACSLLQKAGTKGFLIENI